MCSHCHIFESITKVRYFNHNRLSTTEACQTINKYRVRQKNLTVFKSRYIGNRVAGVMQPMSVASWFHAISLATEQWTTQHRAFAVEAYLKNGGSAVTTQRLFRRHFNIPRHGRVPCRNTIKEWVQNFRGKYLGLKKKTPRQNSYGTNTGKC